MNPHAVFGLSILVSFLSSIVLVVFLARPWLRTSNGEQALIWLMTPHMFLRFIGLSFLVPGVVSGSLPNAWAVPAGYGDFVAGILGNHCHGGPGPHGSVGHCGGVDIQRLARGRPLARPL